MLLIFDFDGTIADTFDIFVDIFNTLAVEYNFKRVTPEEIKPLRARRSQELLDMFDIPKYKLPLILLKGRAMLTDQIDTIEIFPDLPEILPALARKHTLGIITSNSEKNVKKLLDKYGLTDLFAFIDSSKHIFGKAKVIEKMVEKYGFEKSDVYYIGDETRDIEAAQEAGVGSVAVTWGFNAEAILVETKPNVLIQSPANLKIFR